VYEIGGVKWAIRSCGQKRLEASFSEDQVLLKTKTVRISRWDAFTAVGILENSGSTAVIDRKSEGEPDGITVEVWAISAQPVRVADVAWDMLLMGKGSSVFDFQSRRLPV